MCFLFEHARFIVLWLRKYTQARWEVSASVSLARWPTFASNIATPRGLCALFKSAVLFIRHDYICIRVCVSCESYLSHVVDVQHVRIRRRKYVRTRYSYISIFPYFSFIKINFLQVKRLFIEVRSWTYTFCRQISLLNHAVHRNEWKWNYTAPWPLNDDVTFADVKTHSRY